MIFFPSFWPVENSELNVESTSHNWKESLTMYLVYYVDPNPMHILHLFKNAQIY